MSGRIPPNCIIACFIPLSQAWPGLAQHILCVVYANPSTFTIDARGSPCPARNEIGHASRGGGIVIGGQEDGALGVRDVVFGVQVPVRLDVIIVDVFFRGGWRGREISRAHALDSADLFVKSLLASADLFVTSVINLSPKALFVGAEDGADLHGIRAVAIDTCIFFPAEDTSEPIGAGGVSES